MKALLAILLGAIVLCTTGCPSDNDAGNGGTSSGSPQQPGPGPTPDPTPRPDNPLALLSPDVISQVHTDLLDLQKSSSVALNVWNHLSGAKLYQVLVKYANIHEAELETPVGDRLFNLLLDSLQDTDGTVKPSIDANDVTQKLIQEYYKGGSNDSSSHLNGNSSCMGNSPRNSAHSVQ